MIDKRSKKLLLLLPAFFLYFLVDLSAQALKRLYIANDDHTDYMWSGDLAMYDSAFVKMLDYHLDKIDATKNKASNFQNRYNCDGSYWLKTYQKYRSPAQFNRLINAIKSGHISSPLNSVVSTFGAQGAEAAIRGMFYAGQLERKYKLRFSIATAMENNTVPLGLSSIWAGSGARYSWKGIGGYGSQLSYESRANRKHQLYRYTGLDSSSVIMKWYAYNEKKHSFGGYAECRMIIKAVDTTREIGKVIEKLDAFCDTITPGAEYPYNVGGAFGFGHDDLQTFVSDPFIHAAEKGTTPTRSVRVSNEEDFFLDIERSYPNLPSLTVSYGNEWDLLCASMNETTAEVRRAMERLRTAEALASVASINSPLFADRLITARNLAWDALGLYWEHNWTGDGPVANSTRGQWQAKLKEDLCGYVDSLGSLSAKTLASQLKKTTNQRFLVFNSLSWVRDDWADIAYEDMGPVKVTDLTTKEEIPSQFITKKGKRFLRIQAKAIPSVGYKIYEIQKGIPARLPNAAEWKDGYLTNERYRIKLSNSGVVTEIHDKSLGSRQLVKAQDGRYLNDLGTTDINDGRPLELENAGPVSVTLKAVSNNPIAHTVRLTLFANSSRIEIENSIDTNFTDNRFWTFSFDIENPTTRHEELGAILTVKKESNGGHYADQNARYDWQSFNHFADISHPEYGVILSNTDCSFFKLGKSRVDSLWEQSSQLHALAGGQIDRKWEDNGLLGIHRQLGQQQFNYHFAIVPYQGKFSATASMKASLEHQTPFSTSMLTGKAGSSNQLSFSLLRISDPDVLLWSVKPAEEGIKTGLITRFWNLKEESVQPFVKLYKPIKSAWKTTHLETNEKQLKPIEGALQTAFNPQQINTYRLGLIKN